MPEPESEAVGRFRQALEEGLRRHRELMRLNTYPASQEEIRSINLFLHTYWTWRDSDLIDIPTWAHHSFTIGQGDVVVWEAPYELTARTIDGEQILNSEHWQKFVHDWYILKSECEERRAAKWEAEAIALQEKKDIELAAEYGELLGQYWKAEEKAHALLLSCISQEQRESLWYNRYFLVTAPDGERFKLENRWHGNIVALDEGGQRYCALCADGMTPKSDSILAQKLALETDPNRLLFISNRVDEHEIVDL